MPLDQAANETHGSSCRPFDNDAQVRMRMAVLTHYTNAKDMWSIVPPWPNGQGAGLLIRRLRVRVPQGVLDFQMAEEKDRRKERDGVRILQTKTQIWSIVPPWLHGLGIGLMMRGVWVGIPEGVLLFASINEAHSIIGCLV